MSINYDDVLALELGPNDSGEDTIQAYLGSLLAELWEWDEGFSGKRPFGNSGWKADLAPALIQAGFIKGAQDEWDEWIFNERELTLLIHGAIAHLCGNRLTYRK